MKALLSTVAVLAIFMISSPLAATGRTITEKDDENLVNLSIGDNLQIKLFQHLSNHHL